MATPRIFTLVSSHTTDTTSYVTFPSAFAPLLEVVSAYPRRAVYVFELAWYDEDGSSSDSSTRHAVYVGWRGALTPAGQQTIGIPSALASCLSIPSGVRVSLTHVPAASPSLHVELAPASADDYEVLALNAAFLTARLLDQVSVLTHGKPFPVWLHGGGAPVRVNVVADWHDNARAGAGAGAGRAAMAARAGTKGFSLLAADSEIAIVTMMRTGAGAGAGADAQKGDKPASAPAGPPLFPATVAAPPPLAAPQQPDQPQAPAASLRYCQQRWACPGAVVWAHPALIAALRPAAASNSNTRTNALADAEPAEPKDGEDAGVVCLLRPPQPALVARMLPRAAVRAASAAAKAAARVRAETKEPGPWAPLPADDEEDDAAAAEEDGDAEGLLFLPLPVRVLPPPAAALCPTTAAVMVPPLLMAAVGLRPGDAVALQPLVKPAPAPAPAPALCLPEPGPPVRLAAAQRPAAFVVRQVVDAAITAGTVAGAPAVASAAPMLAPAALRTALHAHLAKQHARPLLLSDGRALLRVPHAGGMVTLLLTTTSNTTSSASSGSFDVPASVADAAAAVDLDGDRALMLARSPFCCAAAAQAAVTAATPAPSPEASPSSSLLSAPSLSPAASTAGEAPLPAGTSVLAWLAPSSSAAPLVRRTACTCADAPKEPAVGFTISMPSAPTPAPAPVPPATTTTRPFAAASAIAGEAPLLTAPPLPCDAPLLLAPRAVTITARRVKRGAPLKTDATAALGGTGPVVAKLLAALAASLPPVGLESKFPCFASAVLTGERGAGKSSLLARASLLAAWHPRLRACVAAHVDCRALAASRSLPIVREALDAVTVLVRDAAARGVGAVVCCDDLDVLAAAPPADENQADPGESLFAAAATELVRDAVAAWRAALDEHTDKAAPLTLLAAAVSTSSLNPELQAAGVLIASVPLAPPQAPERAEMLLALAAGLTRAQHSGASRVTWSAAALQSIADRAEGFSPQDLSQATQRALHFALRRTISEEAAAGAAGAGAGAGAGVLLELTVADVDAALEGFASAQTRSLSLSAKPTVSWSDIGGLEDVKETLIETLELPTRFARVFKTAPIKLRSGLLLYGPPGSGKTMIASAVAAQCGLAFISVKGPELLSKYIGASEENVRALFARAAAAAPCLLFFDEFDSLAPKRGADSSGVTDRVVNQFLCQLDGVESREGVYVLAASSRPDLIDPALLRPGRLDKAVYCALPETPADRVAVLRAVGRLIPMAEATEEQRAAAPWPDAAWLALPESRFVLGPDADIAALAARAEDMSAADLGALLTNAALAAVKELERRVAGGGADVGDNDERGGKVVVWQHHLDAGLADTSVSLSRTERDKFARIYQRFVASKTPGESETEFDGKAKGRAVTK